MRPVKSGATNRDGASYYYYVCPCGKDGRCENKLFLRGPWLREVVIARLREVLFPLPRNGGDSHTDWLPELIAEVRTKLVGRLEQDQDRRPMLEKEAKGIDAKVAGWMETLSKPDLSSLVRTQVEQQFGIALQRKQQIEVELETLARGTNYVDDVLDPKAAIDRLQRLDQTLAGGNASDINVELSLHIDSILVHPNGTVVVRTDRLGIFEGAAEILAGNSTEVGILDDANDERDGFQIRPRALTRRRTTALTETSILAKADGAIEGRVQLPDNWVDEAVFQMPESTSWAKRHASEVAERRLAGCTIERLCVEFGKTPPTIRSALRHAARSDQRLRSLPRKMPRARWHEDHALEVVAKKAVGLGTDKLAAHFGKSDTTIRKALDHAATLAGRSEAASSSR
jgi:hypothetical protein